jgi:3',5'-nucleoside bisphosphate phosphatase
MFDFHTHTLASDGKLTPRELLLRAANLQIRHLAITDHDSMASCEEGSAVAAELGINFYTGVEISARWENKELHIVGLNVDPDNQLLKDVLHKNQSFRRFRVQAIAEKLAAPYQEHVLDWLANQDEKQVVCRSHVARVLIDAGLEKNMNMVFKRWLGKGKRAYVKPEFAELAEVVGAIRQAGGKAILAHPLKYELSKRQFQQVLIDLKVARGNGVEVVYSGQTPGEIDKLSRICEEFNFEGSVGSDFHYQTPWNQMGKLKALPEGVKPVWAQFLKEEPVDA